jgi:hypothetical protein
MLARATKRRRKLLMTATNMDSTWTGRLNRISKPPLQTKERNKTTLTYR